MSPDDDDACGNLKVMIGIYNPADNTVRNIPGVGETLFHLQPGVNLYEASWGNIANNKVLPQGETIVATIWCPDCGSAPILLFNSQAHPSNVDFPIVVPENSISAAAVALLVPAAAGIVLDMRGRKAGGGESVPKEGGLRKVHRTLIVAAALILLTLPLVITFNSMLTTLAVYTGFDRVVTTIVPLEASAVGDLLRGVGLPAGNSADSVWLAGGALPVVALIDWNCAGWQGFALFGLTSIAGMGEADPKWKKLSIISIGILGTFAVNVLRIMVVVVLGYFAGYQAALVFHDYGGTIMMLVWLLAFWSFILRRESSDAD
jgi:exosortase/archaeosortase family protein